MALLEPEGGIGQLCLALYSRDDAAPLFRAKRFDVARSDLCTRNGAYQPAVHLLAFAIHDWRPALPRHRVGSRAEDGPRVAQRRSVLLNNFVSICLMD
ncbi:MULTISPECIES: hypothetical protein [Bradyrhizobium]|uniref:hypothetical protein n=1 Tax=Bradyrhizobium TaxID=374 RepID=UPI001F0A9F9B|nr:MULTISPECIES: hypothetical protein [Bradyrhizobium]